MFGYMLPVATLLACLPASLCAYNMLLKRPDYSQGSTTAFSWSGTKNYGPVNSVHPVLN